MSYIISKYPFYSSIYKTYYEDSSNQLKESKTSSLLTEREQDVLTELAKGHPTKVIARNLNLAPETIKYHLKHIYAKLGVGNRKEAVTEAWRKAMFS